MSNESQSAQTEESPGFTLPEFMDLTSGIIAIVGPDAAGKTTQSTLLVERLQANGYDARYVHGLYYLSNAFPWSNQIREKVGPRQLRTAKQENRGVLYRISRNFFSRLSYLFALFTILFVSLQSRNQIVVFDRFYHQFFYDVYGPSSIRLLQALPTPWRVVYLDAELAEIRHRMDAMDRSADDSYHQTVIDHYATCASDDWLRYQAELPIPTLHEQIFEDIHHDIESRSDYDESTRD